MVAVISHRATFREPEKKGEGSCSITHVGDSKLLLASAERSNSSPNTSADATCDELVVNHSRYEKKNDIYCCLSRSGTSAGFLL